MNKKLMKELGQKVSEKRGYQWAPTNFALKAWSARKLFHSSTNIPQHGGH